LEISQDLMKTEYGVYLKELSESPAGE